MRLSIFSPLGRLLAVHLPVFPVLLNSVFPPNRSCAPDRSRVSFRLDGSKVRTERDFVRNAARKRAEADVSLSRCFLTAASSRERICQRPRALVANGGIL